MQFAIMFFTMWLVVMPWTIRNYQKFDRFIPVSYNSGYILYINNNDENVHGGWMDHTTISAPESLIEAMAAEVEDHGASIKTSPNLELLMKPYAVDWISSHPIEFLKLGVLRIDATYFSGSWDITANAMNDFKFDPETSSVDAFSFQRNINLLVAVSDIFMALISSFGAVFVFINIWRILKNLFNKRVRLESFMVVPVLNLAFFSLIYFIYEGQPRYNFVTLFLLTMCFAMGLEIIVSHMGKSAEIGVTKDAE